jgi:pimeloyl-ACP methyl ester carboxylesterase
VPRSSPVDGFRLAYERHGAGPPVLLLHGWPGDRGDYGDVVAQLGDAVDAIVPDLRGFGESDKHAEDPARAYSAAAQVRSLLALLDELGVRESVVAGYDVGSRVAQAIARTAPERVRALVITPPVPGVGERVLSADAQREFWYQAFHQLALADDLIDGDTDAVRAYLSHFWTHWSGPRYAPDDLHRLVGVYSSPGAFTASIGWYRAGSGTVASSLAETVPAREERIAAPTTVLWPEHDPLFPPAWGDRLEEFFSAATVRQVAGVGHFVPREAPHAFGEAILAALG